MGGLECEKLAPTSQGDGGCFMMPFYVNSHHALVDGVHITHFSAQIEQEARDVLS